MLRQRAIGLTRLRAIHTTDYRKIAVTNFRLHVAAALIAASTLASTGTFAQTASDWQFQASLYGYFPNIGGRTTFPPPAGGSDVSVDIDDILSDLKMAFMGSFEGRRGRWGGFADVIYMDLGDTGEQSNSFTLGGTRLPVGTSARVGYDLKAAVWTLAGTYRAVETRNTSHDLVLGTRMLDIRPTVTWELSGNVGSIPVIDRAGTREVKEQNWDAIIGARGRVGLSEDGKWFAPYYVDVGTGESSFTWQAMTGVGYMFGWGDVVAAWRYTEYQMKSGNAVEELNLSGPAIAAVFRW
jgi:hypothetical protein